MGIDIYAKWRGMTKAEKKKQITGFDTTAGKFGYLREAYHGEPYATFYFVEEAFEDENDFGALIPAIVLRSRLPQTIKLAIERARKVYGRVIDKNDPVVQSFVEFVELCERKERETGEPCNITASY